MDLPDDMRMDWAAFEACLEDRLQGIPVVTHEEAIDKFVKELTNAIQEAIPASASKRRPCANQRPALTGNFFYEIRLKNRLWIQWKVMTDPALNAQVNRLQISVTYRLNKWTIEKCNDNLESLDSEDQLWKVTKRVIRFPASPPSLQVRGVLAPSL